MSFIRNDNYSSQQSYSSTLAVPISRIRACQRYKILLLHFQLDWTAKDLKFCSRTSVLSWLLKIWSSASASALPLCGDCQRSQVTLPHCTDNQWCEFPLPHLRSALTTHNVTRVTLRTSALSILPKMWSSVFALPSCLDCQRYEIQLPHFCSARTSKGLKLRFHTSALPWLAKIRNSAFKTSVLPGLRKISSSASALFRPGLQKMWRSTSAFHLCRDFQRCEVPLPHFCFALTVKDLKVSFPANTLL